MATKKTGKSAPARNTKLKVSDLQPRKDAKGGGRHAEGRHGEGNSQSKAFSQGRKPPGAPL